VSTASITNLSDRPPLDEQSSSRELPSGLERSIESEIRNDELRGAVREILRWAVASDMDVTAEQIANQRPETTADLSRYLKDRAINIAEKLISRHRSA